MSLPMDYTSTVARGAASELIACAYLMARGYHVFRAVAASCPYDLIACRAEESLRVEVKSLARKWFAFPWPENDGWDLLLVVGLSGDVHEVRPGTDRLTAINAIRAAYGVGPVTPRGGAQRNGVPIAVQMAAIHRGLGFGNPDLFAPIAYMDKTSPTTAEISEGTR